MPTPVQVLNCQNLKMYFSQLQLVEEGIILQINQLGCTVENYVCAEHFSSENYHFQLI